MSIFAESSWEADAIGDKLSKQLFQKKKKGKKDGKRNKPSPESLSKHIKVVENIQLNGIARISIKSAKAKPKKRSLSNSAGNEVSGPSEPTNPKSCTNVQPAKNGKASAKDRQRRAKKRKRSLSNSIGKQENGPSDSSTAQLTQNGAASAKGKKFKAKKRKRSLSNSTEMEEAILSSAQPAENGPASLKRGKLKAKKPKRSLSNSTASEEWSVKKSNITPGQSTNSRNSESPRLTKKPKDLNRRSKEESHVANKKSFLSKNNKTVINKKVHESAEANRGKSTVSASATGQQTGNQETKSQRKRKKEKLKKNAKAPNTNGTKPESDASQKFGEISAVKSLDMQRLEKMLAVKNKKDNGRNKVHQEPTSLRDRMMSQLRASRFRFLNETLYNNESSESKKYFKEDPEAFAAYHSGYRQQVEQWPLNPLDVIISSIKKMSKEYIVADFGCGEARLAESVTQKVHSFDLVAVNDNVKACDMAHTPLLTNGVNVVVFCLSLMGTNLADYLLEANRVLKTDGILKIADVESRFENVDEFISILGSYGFTNTWKDLSHNLFYFMDFKKVAEVNRRNKKLPEIVLKSCLYKRR